MTANPNTNTTAREVVLVPRELPHGLYLTSCQPHSSYSESWSAYYQKWWDNILEKVTITQQQSPHPDALPDGTLSKPTHKRLIKLQGGEQEALEYLAREYERRGFNASAANVRSRTYPGYQEAHDIAVHAITAALRSKQPEASEGDVAGWQIVQKNRLSVGGIYRSQEEAIESGMFDAEIDELIPLYTTPPRHPAEEPVIRSSMVELALFEEENETTYPGYTRLHIPYDAWCWDMDTENLLINRKNIDFAQSTKDYYDKVPITHIRATIDGKAQVIRLSRFLCLGPEGITPIFAAGQLRIAAL